MVKKQQEKVKAKGKAATARPEARSNSSKRRLGARLVESLRRLAVRSFASVAKSTAAPARPTKPWTAVAMTAIITDPGMDCFKLNCKNQHILMILCSQLVY
jgi:hypothetical protein